MLPQDGSTMLCWLKWLIKLCMASEQLDFINTLEEFSMVVYHLTILNILMKHIPLVREENTHIITQHLMILFANMRNMPLYKFGLDKSMWQWLQLISLMNMFLGMKLPSLFPNYLPRINFPDTVGDDETVLRSLYNIHQKLWEAPKLNVGTLQLRWNSSNQQYFFIT